MIENPTPREAYDLGYDRGFKRGLEIAESARMQLEHVTKHRDALMRAIVRHNNMAKTLNPEPIIIQESDLTTQNRQPK